jgi:hypothetical protein
MSDVHGARSPTVTQKWHEIVDQPPPKSGGVVKRQDPEVSKAKVSESRNLFNAFFSESVNNLGKVLKLSPEQMKKLGTESQQGYNEIMKNTFDKHASGAMKSSEFSTLVRTAHTKAQEEIIKLTKDFGAPSVGAADRAAPDQRWNEDYGHQAFAAI